MFVASTSKEEVIKYRTSDGKEVEVRVESMDDKQMNPDELLRKMNEVGVFEQDGAWSTYSSYRNVTQKTIKKFMFS